MKTLVFSILLTVFAFGCTQTTTSEPQPESKDSVSVAADTVKVDTATK